MINTPFAVDVSTSHGHKKHRSSSLSIRQRIDQDGALLVWANPVNGRHARVCRMEAGIFGIQIIQLSVTGNWQEVTCFTKSKMTRIEQIKQYLKNTGYAPIQ